MPQQQARSTAAPPQISADAVQDGAAQARQGRSIGAPPSTGTVGQPPAPYSGGQVGSGTRVGLLGNRDVFETPFNSTGYTDKLITDQQARSVSDVIDNDPSVRTNSPRYSGIDGFLIRGLPLFASDIAFDGLYGIVDTRRPALEPIERVEILKGPSALLYGISPFGNIGGAVNFIPKRATDDPITRMTVGYVSEGQYGTGLDFGRRFGPNNAWGIRFNGAYRDGRTPIDFQTDGFGVAALALDYRGERFRATADLGYQQQDLDAPTRVRSVLPGFPIPVAPPLHINQQQPWGYYTSDHRYGVLRTEYDITDQLTLHAAYGRSYSKEVFFGGTLQILNGLGDFRSTPALTPTDSERESAEVGLRGRFETGPVKHSVALSTVGLWHESGFASAPIGPVITSNLYDPVYLPPRSTLGLSRHAPLSSWRINRSIGIADTLSAFDDRVLLTLGGRWQEINVKNFNTTTGLATSTSRNDAFSPAAGMVVKPLANLSLYANYIEGLTSGGIAPANAVNAGEAFPAFVSRQIEVGAKYDFGTVGVSVAAFQITQPSGFTDPVTRRFAVNGEQRNRGVEFNIFGEVAPGARLLGGVTLLDGVLTETAGGLNDGNVAVGVPEVQLNLYGEYDLPYWLAPGLTLTGRMIYTSSQFYDQANTQTIPEWTRVDLGMRYTTRVQGKPVTLRASVENLFDNDYWATTGRGYLTPGSPRTYLISASFDF